MKPVVVAMTGASGIAYGVRLVQVLTELEHPVDLVVSDPARLVLKEEMRVVLRAQPSKEEFRGLFGTAAESLVSFYSVKDFTAPVASGSYPTEGMIIIPCSMGTLAAVASGISQNLIHRAADCCLKEGRKLVMVPRETPLSPIHLENMLKLARIGVRIVPAMPGFYAGTQKIEELIDFVVGKVLDQLEISHTLYPRWTGLSAASIPRNPEPGAVL